MLTHSTRLVAAASLPPAPMLYRAELRSVLDSVLAKWRAEHVSEYPASWSDAVFEMVVEYYERLLVFGPVDMRDFEENVASLVECYADNFARPSRKIRIPIA